MALATLIEPELQLVAESKIARLLGHRAGRRLEASGVLTRGDRFSVIFDSSPYLAELDPDLRPGPHYNRMRLLRDGLGTGYEDLAADRRTGRLFVLIEALPRGETFMAEVEEYDEELALRARKRLDFPLPSLNKGIEGLSCVVRDGVTYLLGMCEGNRCRAGREGRRPGGGRIHVFAERTNRWERTATIHLPSSLAFRDYSGLSVREGRMVVASQESSALWVGRLRPDVWDIADEGAVYRFPRDGHGRVTYGTIEGVSWLAPDRVVVVSDRAKPEQPARYRLVDQSVHIFALPHRAEF